MAPSGTPARQSVATLDALSPREHAGWWGLRFRVRERLARSFAVVPLLYMVGAFGLAELVAGIEGPRDLLGLDLDADSARTFLSAVASGMIAFTGVVVSLAVVVVQYGASQYSPRLIQRFRREPIVKHALGIFIAPAIASLVSLRSIGEDGAAQVPSLTLALNLVLLVAAIIVFFLLVGHLLDLLRPRRIVAQVVDQGLVAIEDVFPYPLGEAPLAPARPDGPSVAVLVHHGRPKVLAALDRAALVREATKADVVLEVGVGIGDYVRPGTTLLVAHRGTPPALDRRRLERAVILDEERTIAQDPAFAIRALVDIALRALSPAVNDPTTAVQALDGIETLLVDLAGRNLERGRIADTTGEVRLVYPTATWPGLLDLALSETLRYGADSPQIGRRLRALLLALEATAHPARLPAIGDELARLDRALDTAIVDPVERAHAARADHMGLSGVDG